MIASSLPTSAAEAATMSASWGTAGEIASSLGTMAPLAREKLGKVGVVEPCTVLAQARYNQEKASKENRKIEVILTCGRLAVQPGGRRGALGCRLGFE